MIVGCCGCWSRVEIERMGFISMVGVDRSGGELLVSFQIVNPRALSSEGAGGGGSEPSVFVLSVKARTISEAMAKINQESPRSLHFKQLYAIVLGEDLGKQGILPVVDYFARYWEIRRSIWVVTAKGSAQEILLKGAPVQERVPGLAVRMLMERRERFASTYYPVKLGNFLNSMSLEGSDALAAAVSVRPMQEEKLGEGEEGKEEQGKKSQEQGEAIKTEEGKEIVFEGAGVFRGDKLTAYLGPHEVRGALWVLGENQGSAYAVPSPSKGTWATLTTEKASVRVSPVVDGDDITYKVDVEDRSYICYVVKEGLEILNPETLKVLEREKEKAVKRDIEAAVRRSQELHSDFLQLGDKLYREHPEAWDKVKDDWREAWLPQVKVDINVSSKIERTGTIDNPISVRSP
jgi:spore germination protein KC